MGIAVILAALFLQSTALKFLLPYHLVPNFCLIFLVFLAFYEVSVIGAVLSFIIGIVFDVSAGVLLGPWSAAFTASYCVLILLSRRIFVDSFPAAMLVVFISALFSTAIYTGLLYQFQPATFDVYELLTEAAVTAAVSPFVLGFFQRLLVQKMALYSLRGSSVM